MSSIKIVLACVALAASVNAQCIDRDATCATQISVPIEQGGYDIRWCEAEVHYLSFYMRTWCQSTCDLCPVVGQPAEQPADTTTLDPAYRENGGEGGEGGETGMSSNAGGNSNEGRSSQGGGGMGGGMGGKAMGGGPAMSGPSMGMGGGPAMSGMGHSKGGSSGGSSGESGSGSYTNENGNSYGYLTASATNSDSQNQATPYLAVGGVVVLVAGLAGVSFRMRARKEYSPVDTDSTENIIV